MTDPHAKECFIWVFQNENGVLASAVFDNLQKAESCIEHHALSGTLTKMPLNQCVYDWVIAQNYFTPKREEQKTAAFIQRFTSAYLEHYHYIKGKNVSEDE